MENKYSVSPEPREREGKGNLQKEESSTITKCCRNQENEQLRVLGDLKKRHFIWVLEVTAGLCDLEVEKAK